MVMKKCNFWLEEEVIDALEERAERFGIKVSTLLRMLVTDGLQQEGKFDLLFERIHDLSKLMQHGNAMAAGAVVAAAMAETGRQVGDSNQDAYKAHLKGVMRTALTTGEALKRKVEDGSL